MRVLRVAVGVLAVGFAASCVSGSKVRADADVVKAEIERARRSGAMKCAPRELAIAEANLDFALGELSQGSTTRASGHMREADAAVSRALELSKECGPKQVLVKDKEPDKKAPPPVVVKIEEVDSDGDGRLDKDDQCPDKAEDKDGFEDDDGCPENDNDQDGVLDGNDKCALVPGPLSNQGCPEEAPKDTDGDGVVDPMDKCPNQPEDKDQFQDEDGCPELDNDGDGLLDSSDQCPTTAGQIQNLGCPVLDKDGDGINDDKDKCADEPEDKDGYQDLDGCPDLDNDDDGVPDAQDNCPNQVGPSENKGCADTDKDADGVFDRNDKCPEVTGPKENEGCPDKDSDGDGLNDRFDKCPTVSGAKENEGCPDKDSDGDGVADRLDRCNDQAGPKENGGCPDADGDGDGSVDRMDKCPLVSGPIENFGCPELDRDGDGVVDKNDKCLSVPGMAENDGCPDKDTDGDTIVDRLDKCPAEAGLAAKEGCPELDKDKDGIPDAQDKCPDEYGVAEQNGCPKVYKRVVVTAEKIVIKQQIKFKTGSATILGKDSYEVLRDVALAMKDNPRIKKLRIEGHTDSVGNDTSNLRLSQKRADAVMAQLIRNGVDPARMEAVGYGEAQPIASNSNAAGRAENRRTEFKIVEQ